MCPVCIANLALIAAGTTSGGGLAALLTGKFFKDRIALSKCRTHVTQATSLWGRQVSCLSLREAGKTRILPDRSLNPERAKWSLAPQPRWLCHSRGLLFSKRANNTKHESEK